MRVLGALATLGLSACATLDPASVPSTFGSDTSAIAFIPSADNPRCAVRRIVDGDTITIRCASGAESAVRLVGYDAPETFQPQCTAEKELGLQAKNELRNILSSAVLIAPKTQGRDKYSRPLVALTIDGVPLASLMVSRGVARPYDGGRRDSWCG
ncbi:thermonuclease family protein [Pseudaestuariivita sp.]|uniref:thermonuclease family protein n=1 Tax=Pseudaestuariivita sp. TaxID=2211669 RepID=UPI0040599605